MLADIIKQEKQIDSLQLKRKRRFTLSNLHIPIYSYGNSKTIRASTYKLLQQFSVNTK